jgi:hypothetical protein
MTIILIPLTAEQLSKHFNPQTVYLLCSHICTRLFINLTLPPEITQEDRTKAHNINDKFRTYLGSISRFDNDSSVQETPRISILCITILQKAPGGTSTDTVVSQFELTREGLDEISAAHILTFLIVLLKESVQSMKSRFLQTAKLSTAVSDYITRIVDQGIKELAPLIGAPQAWSLGPNVVDQYTTILLRLRIGEPY